MSRRTFIASFLALQAAVVLSGCGFQLRGAQPLPFDSLYVGADLTTPFGAALRQQIAAGADTQVVADAGEADARLEILRNNRSRDILSLTGAGRVREYQLTQTVVFRVIDRGGNELLPPSSVTVRREYNFDDDQIIAREQEEALLIRDMEEDIVQQMLRRMAAIRS
ncbi:MAG TPA: LPS assembly lipoprotein LptE [Azoarcus taiwanensis]|nr:LPS assembly lipoprotein LptE [Azoarcus taiwanensis]